MDPNTPVQASQQTTPVIQPPPTQVTPSAPSNKTKYILLGILILVIVSAVGAGAYFMIAVKPLPTIQQNNNTSSTITLSPSPTPVQTITTDSTASWKTYIDKTFNISFKYPNGFEIVKQLQNPNTQVFSLLFEFKSADIKSEKNNPQANIPISLLYVYNPSKLSLDALNESLTNPISAEGPGLASSGGDRVTNPNGVVAYYDKEHYCVSMCQSYTWSYKSQVYQLIYYPNSVNQTEINNKLFDNIFSTFKFTQ